MLTQFDLDIFDAILGGERDHFSAQLVRLIKKADHENRAILATVYPAHVAAVQQWEIYGDARRLWICACHRVSVCPNSLLDFKMACAGCGRQTQIKARP